MDHETDDRSTGNADTGAGASTTTDTTIMPSCPLCGTPPLTPATTVESSAAMLVRFAPCPRCQAMVTSSHELAEANGVDVDIDDADADPDQEAQDDNEAVVEQTHRRLAEATTAAAPSLAWELAQHLAPPAEAAAVVDLSAGRGALVSALGRLGYPAKGCEPSAFLCQMARASYLLGPDLLANTTADAYLDRLEADPAPISAFVLDHLVDRHPDPLGLLRRCVGLAPGGRLFIELPIGSPDLLVPEQRFHATPTTVEFLADELQVGLISVSVVKPGGLRVVAAIPDPDVVDLDGRAHNDIDLEAVELACRALSPVFDRLNPETDTSSRPQSRAEAEPADAKGGR